MPDVELPAWVVEVTPTKDNADAALKALRRMEPAVLAYIHDDKLCFNARTVSEEELPVLVKLIKEVLA
jgi:L-seryl-tRNA(Ser) seleniumtransferase